MTRTEELMKLAEAAREVASGGVEKPWQVREVKLAKACEQLVELVRLQHDALKEYPTSGEYFMEHMDATARRDEAIAAFNKFEGGGE